MSSFTPTNPGLAYDPRNRGTARFFEALEKELGKQHKMLKKPVPKPKDFQNPQPLPDPGPAEIRPMPNPRFKNTIFGR